MVKNVYRNIKMKIWLNMDFNFTLNWRQFDVNVLENTLRTKKNNSGISGVPCDCNQILA